VAVSRVVAITGASAGIGRATALRLARDGAALVVCARRTDKLAALAADIGQAGGAALPITADVTDAGAMVELVRAAVDRFGRLDAMKNDFPSRETNGHPSRKAPLNDGSPVSVPSTRCATLQPP